MAKRMALAFSDTNGEKIEISNESHTVHEGSASASPGNDMQHSLQHQIHPSQSRFLYNHNSHHTLY